MDGMNMAHPSNSPVNARGYVVGGAKVLLVAIISAVGTALAGLAAVITALATLGELRRQRETGKPLTSPPSWLGAKGRRAEVGSWVAEGGPSEPLTMPRTSDSRGPGDGVTPPPKLQ
jgi:hypothetical protein